MPDATDPKGKPVPIDPKDPKKGNIKPRVEIPFDTDKNGKVPTDKPIQREEHDRKAEEAMGKLIPGWLKPPKSTWHHQGYDPKTGRGTMELVPSDIHKAVPHDGAYSDYIEEFEKNNPKKKSK